MKLYRYSGISFLLMCICTMARAPKKINPTDNAQKQIIIFDLTNVLIKENQIGFAKKIGYGTLASYTITHWKSPGYRCLDMLHAMSNHETQKPHITITLNKRIMPRCLVELQEGKKTCAQAKGEIAQCIELLDGKKFFSSSKEKILMGNIMNLILDPEAVESVIEPVKPTVHLVQKLKAAGYPVYLCANAPEELYATAKNKFPEIIELFDGIVISSQAKTVKPDAAIFNHLITTHNLNPTNCILIDDLEASAATARTLGMQAIVFDKISHVTNKLKKCGVTI
jgi:HAD superfamily hydrolase (TIGR01509 family)